MQLTNDAIHKLWYGWLIKTLKGYQMEISVNRVMCSNYATVPK